LSKNDRAALEAQGYDFHTWSNGPGTVYAVHAHEYDKVILVMHGSIQFQLPATGEKKDLDVGDRLDLPAHTPHSALVGPDGVECLEGQKRRTT
jgi:quercetin dioxygenase-like cupin family protein